MASKRPPNITTVLPSGVVIEFWDETGLDGKPQTRRYMYDGQKLVSISTVANVFDKPALPAWAAGVTLEGVVRLHEFWNRDNLVTADDYKRVLRDQGLDHDSVRDKAADRGTAAHDALLSVLRDGKLPNLSDFEPDWRPYMKAGFQMILDEEPEVIDTETIVASVKHGFAGRYDLYARFPHRGNRTGRIDYKTVTRWSYKPARKDGSCDLRDPYPEHLSQVEGYEIAAIESAMEPSDFRAVVRLGPDGAYDFTESWAQPEHFLGDLASYRNRQSINAAGAAKRKADKKAAKAQEVVV